jgi:hypothetical protein
MHGMHFACCNCSSGPMVVAINPRCTNCHHEQCPNCDYDIVYASSKGGDFYVPELPRDNTEAFSTRPSELNPYSQLFKPYAIEKDESPPAEYGSDHSSPTVAETTVEDKSSILSIANANTTESAVEEHSSLASRSPTSDFDQQPQLKDQNLLYSSENAKGKASAQDEHCGVKACHPDDATEEMPQKSNSGDVSDSQTIKAESENDSELGPIDTSERTDSETEGSNETLCDSGPEADEDDSSTRSKISTKHQVLDDFILRFSKWLNDYLRRQLGGSQLPNGEASSNFGLERNGPAEANVNSSLRRKRGSNQRPSGDGSADEEDETPGKKRPKSSKPSPSDGSERRKFACPFYQRRKNMYCNWRSCVGPGWDTVHRIK